MLKVLLSLLSDVGELTDHCRFSMGHKHRALENPSFILGFAFLHSCQGGESVP